MARQVDLISTTNGIHYIEVGLDSDSLASFQWQLWVTKYGKRAVDFLQSLSLGFVSFMGGDLWVHNSDDVDRCNLFGEAKNCEVGVVANEQPNIVKLLDSIGIHSDGRWEVVSVTIPKTLNHPNGMYSVIPKERFKKREGVWQSEFLRNMKTTSGTASVIEAIKGEPLRGRSAYILLRNTDTSQVKLFKTDIRMSGSRGSIN
jgi:hypothetical protein